MPPLSDESSPGSHSTASDLVLVVDAGGSKTAAWLVEATGIDSHVVLGRGRSTSGNPLSVGFAEATRAIVEAVGQAQTEARSTDARVSRAVLSIAGSADPEIRNRFIHWGRNIDLAGHIAVVSDVLPILAAGTPDCFGVALISGTGSVAFGRAPDGRTTRCGGWGYMLGDEGSGFAIGRDALRRAMDDREVNLESQPLTTALFRFLGAATISEITRAVYGSADPRATVASIAPLVMKSADEGDATAQSVLDTAAGDLARLAARTAKSISLTNGPFPLAVAGGILAGSTRLQDRLRIELNSMSLDCDMRVVDEPLQGCIRLADPKLFELAVSWPL